MGNFKDRIAALSEDKRRILKEKLLEKNIKLNSDKKDIPVIEDREYYDLSSAQKSLYFLNQLDKESTSYNMPGVLKIEGNLNIKRLEESFKKLINRHESLRTSFKMIDGIPVQKIHKEVDFKMEYIELNEEKGLESTKSFVKAFDLSKAPLLRVKVIKTGEDKHIMIFDMHHIMADGTSVTILLNDFTRIYNGEDLPELRIQYKDFSEWQKSLFEKEVMKKQEEYWLGLYSDKIPVLEMPLDYKRPEVQSFNGQTIDFEISKENIEKLNQSAISNQTTLNTVLFGLYSLIVSKYTSQNDIVIGAILAGRQHSDLNNVIGMFANFLPIRVKIEEDISFINFIQEMRKILLRSYENQDFPFDKIVEGLEGKIDRRRNPLFDTMFIYHNEFDALETIHTGDLKFSNYPLERRTSKLDFKFDVYLENNGKLKCALEYNIDLFKEESMTKFISHFKSIVDKVAYNPELMIADLEILTEEESKELEKKREINKKTEERTINIAISATFTSEPIEDYIKWWTEQFDINTSIKFASYNQVFQELLNPESIVSKNEGINLLLIRFEDWLREENKISDEEKIIKLERNYRELMETIKSKKKKGPWFFGIFPVSTHLNFSKSIVNRILGMYDKFKNDLSSIENAFDIDFRELKTLYNIAAIFDSINDKEGHIPFSGEFYAGMGSLIARKIRALYNQGFKVIAIDCDNTLWDGACGEEGVNVKVTQYHRELQQFLLGKYNEGMLLTLCSKNNEKDVWEVFEKNNEMILKKDNFAAWRINWNNKSVNLKEIAEELNLGIDSIIFLDDSKTECIEVMTNCPEVLTLELPEKVEEYPLFLKHVWAFDKLVITQEDKIRGELYNSEKHRKDAAKNAGSLNDYLKSLELKVSMRLMTEKEIPRVSQLTFRTNQFNLTTIRRTEEEIEKIKSDKACNCWVINVTDRFGDYGLTGFLITKDEGNALYIDTLLLSCRVLGRNVEDSILCGLKTYCTEKKIEIIKAKYIPTEKNKPILDFINKTYWNITEQKKEHIKYSLNIRDIKDKADSIDFYYKSYFDEKNGKEDVKSKSVSFYLDHIAVAVNNISNGIKYYSAIGYKCSPEIYDPKQNVKLSICVHEKYDSIELVAPYNEDSPCNNEIEMNGDTPYHLCFKMRKVSDFIEKLELNNIEYEIVSNAKEAILFDDKKVTFIIIKDVGLFELLEEPDELELAKLEKGKIGRNNTVRHIVINIEEAISFYQIMGYEIRKNVNDKKREIIVVNLEKEGAGYLELISPMNNSSAEYNFLKKNGSHLYNILYEVSDIKKYETELEKNNHKFNLSKVENNYGLLEKADEIIYFSECQFILLYNKVLDVKIKDQATWKISIVNEKELFHRNCLLPLEYYTGEQLLKLPIYQINKVKIVREKYVAPVTDIEKKLVEIWQDVLKVDKIGINDNFFKLGGHSLKATTVISKIHKEFEVELPLKEIFKTPTVRELAKYIEYSKKSEYQGIEKAKEKEYYELSSAQKRLYFFNQLDKESTGYNISGVLKIEGELDVKSLEDSFRKLINRHESLRTSFEMKDGTPVQMICREVGFGIEFAESKQGNELEDFKDFIKAFDLSKAPLLRIKVVKVKENEHILMFDMHHIISDGISIGILINDFARIYKGEDLPELSIQYKDFAIWQNRIIGEGKLKKQEDYWLNKFKSEIPVLDMPLDFKRPNYQNFEGEAISFNIDKKTIEDLKEYSSKKDMTLFMILLAAYNVLLYKYSGQEDIVIGTPIAGRRHADLEKIIGMFVNTLAIRNYPAGEKRFMDFLKEVKDNCMSAYENQEYQFEELIEKLKIKRDLSRNPLFDTMFALQNMEINEINIEKLNFIQLNNENKISKFDLILTGTETEKGVQFELEYCRKLFKKETMERFAKHFEKLLKEILEKPEALIKNLDVLTGEEKKKIIHEFNDTKVEYSKNKTIINLIEEQVAGNPENIAVIFGDKKITYGELNEKANMLSYYLMEKGVDSETIVGIMMEKSLETIIGIIGILKAGGAYLPIDTDYPDERIDFMIKDSGLKIIITQGKYKEKFNQKELSVFYIDENFDLIKSYSSQNPLSKIKSNNLAYLIYTSGSTGKPKGVMVEHRSLINLSEWHDKYYCITSEDRATMYAKFGFDASVWEIFPYLIKGAGIHIIKEELKLDFVKLNEYFEQNRITVTFLPTQVYEQFNEIDNKSLRLLLTGGDKLKKYKERKYKLFNNYGPTENTVVTTSCEINKEYENIPIGKPIFNNKIYVLDRSNQLQPVGVPGELCISGASLTRGYLKNKELTAEKFVNNPYENGSKMYKTGDLVKWMPDGNIEFLGRIDFQVKIRGNRIELGEIESLLLKYEGIEKSAVIAKEDKENNNYLCAYYISNKEISITEVRNYLSKELPEYMIPSYFVKLENMPLTPNGKIDRKALPDPEENISAGEEYIAPTSHIEKKLSKIWQDVLGIERIGINDNFFERGGHSLKATTLVSRIHKEFEVDLPLKEVFKTPTVKELSKYIEISKKSGYQRIEKAEEKEYYELSSAQKRLYILNQLDKDSLSYNMPGIQIAEGTLAVRKLEDSFKKLITRHESLRTSFESINGIPVQKIHKEVKFEIEYIEEEEKNILEALKDFVKAFDLTKSPLLRVKVIKIKDTKHILMFDVHHIISDGTSMKILINDFVRIYNGEELPELRIQYKDFSEWQNILLKKESIKRQEEFWLEKFKGEIPVLEMPTDYTRPAIKSDEGSRVDFRLGIELVKRLTEYSSKSGATLFMVLLACFNILLSKYSGQEDIVVGTPIAGRRHSDLENILGMFINILAIRNYPDGKKSFKEFLYEVKENCMASYENQDYQFEELADKLNIRRNFSRNPLFDVVFVLQNLEMKTISLKDLNFTTVDNTSNISKFDMVLYAMESEDRIDFNLEYCTKLFKKETMERFIRHFENVLKISIKNPEIKISDIDILTEEERKEIFFDFNATDF